MRPYGKIICVLLGILVLNAKTIAAEAKVKELESPISINASFVTVNLSGRANSELDVKLPANKITVNGIPFLLPDSKKGNNVFLKNAGWANCQKDPSSYYSPYDCMNKVNTETRFLFSVPVADYSGIWLLAATDNDKALSETVSFRIGSLTRSPVFDQVKYHDFETTVPRLDAKPGRSSYVKTPMGNVYLVHLPINKSLSQDFVHKLSLDVDVTKKLRLALRRPDPCRYQIRPLGLPSGVHIFGMTFQLNPFQLKITGTEPGNVFVDPDTPEFDISIDILQNWIYRFRGRQATLEAVTKDYYGKVTRTEKPVSFWTEDRISHGLMDSVKTQLKVNCSTYGYHELTINLKSGRSVMASWDTTFAYLPPDTREHRNECPVGTWSFEKTHFNTYNADLIGSLFYKAGLRYGMFGYSDAIRKKYNVIKGTDPKSDLRKEAAVQKMKELIKDPDKAKVDRFLIFHETAISGNHVQRVPSMFTGKDYEFDEKEKKKFDDLWNEAEVTAKKIKELNPLVEIYFGNGTAVLLEEFLKRKFPKDLLGSRGNEAGSFMRMPESQPLDIISNNSSLWIDRTILDHYGYKDTPLRQCYEICYPCTNPGNLSLATQAKYLARHIVHSMVWQIPIIRPGCIADSGSSYYFSNWGASGFCFGAPQITPKPAYPVIAVLTQVLDGATFARIIDTKSPVVYCPEFTVKVGRNATRYIYCLWTIQGKRPLTIKFAETKKRKKQEITLTDLMGNESVPVLKDGQINITVTDAMQYLTTDTEIADIIPGKAEMEQRPKGKTFVISKLDKLNDWEEEKEHNRMLEFYNFLCPRKKGDFDYAEVKEFEGEKGVVKVTPKPVGGSQYLPMYSELTFKKPVSIPGEPTEIGLMVNGNGGWGRIIFELEDASGQHWTSIGAEMKGEPTRWMADWMSKEEFAKLKTSNMSDWNTNDAWKRSYINFEGWRYLRFPLPGNYPGEQYHWPYSSQWKYDGDGIVKYPLKFTKLIITMPEKALSLTEYKPAKRKEIYLKDLMVTYDPPEKAFHAE